MKEKEVNGHEEAVFFIAKFNTETLWCTESTTKKQCLQKLLKKLNIPTKAKIPKGSVVNIMKVTVNQTLAEEIK